MAADPNDPNDPGDSGLPDDRAADSHASAPVEQRSGRGWDLDADPEDPFDDDFEVDAPREAADEDPVGPDEPASGRGDDDIEAGDDDDDIEADDDDDDAGNAGGEDLDEGDPARRSRSRRKGMASTLLVLGAGVWAVAMVMRCGSPPPEGGLAVTPSADAPEDSVARQPADAEDRIRARPDAKRASDRTGEDVEDRGEDDVDAESAGDTPPEEEQPLPPEDWARDPQIPSKVTYTVRRGGTLENIANLYKIYHHEILELNPGIPLDRELAPGTAVNVYRRPADAVSESVGVPSRGTLEGGVPMLQGTGRVLKMIPWKSFATADTVAVLDATLRQWARSHEQPVLVGNMSARKGGRLEPHSTHQSGRDVDLGYPQAIKAEEELNWRDMTSDGKLDEAATWDLLQLLRRSGRVEMVFIDSQVQKKLYEYALEHGSVPKSSLGRWLEYPRSPPQRRAFVQHVPGHTDHLHVRFTCPPGQRRCRSRQR